MALQYVGGNSATSASASTISVALNALTGGIGSAAQAGDLVVLVANTCFSTNLDLSATGYTEVYDLYNNGTYDSNLGVFTKRLTGADTTATLAWGNSPTTGAAAVHVWRGVATTALDVAAVYDGANTANPNAPSITTVTNGCVILAVGAAAGDSSAASLANLTVPSGMANLAQANSANTSVVAIASYEQSTAGAYNPAAFGGGGGAALSTWIAVTLALRPSLTGDLTKTLAGATISSAAKLVIGGVLASTLAGATLVAAGDLPTYVEGSADITLGGAGLVSVAANPIAAEAAVSLDGATLIASDAAIIFGEAAPQLAGVVLTSVGANPIAATASLTISGATLAAVAVNGTPIVTPPDRIITFATNLTTDRIITFV